MRFVNHHPTKSWLIAVLLLAPTTAVAQRNPDAFAITLERTTCFGACPAYTVTIDANGTVTYEGKRFVRVEGGQSSSIDQSAVAALLETINRIGFFQLRDEYRYLRAGNGRSTTVTDLPTAFVSVTLGNRSKRVEDYLGAPEGLKQLERLIDETAGTQRWVRIDVATLDDMERSGGVPSASGRLARLRGALRADDVDVVKKLIDLGVDVNDTSDPSGAPPIMSARSGAAARALIAAGANPFISARSGATSLGQAAFRAPEVTEALLEAGVAPDQPIDDGGATALWRAACYGNVGVVRALLAAGANAGVRPGGVSAVACVQSNIRIPRDRRHVSAVKRCRL
jgi:hypothetical protein